MGTQRDLDSFFFFNLSLYPYTSSKRTRKNGRSCSSAEVSLFNWSASKTSPRVLRFWVCHCDRGSGTDDLRVLADDGLKGFIPVNHGTKNQRLEDHRGENKHGKMYIDTLGGDTQPSMNIPIQT